MGVQNLQNYRAHAAAAQWRTERRPSVLGERVARKAIFQGLEEIDVMLAGEKIQPGESRGRSQSPKGDLSVHEPCLPEMKRQRTVVARMHNGLGSAGEADSITEKVHQLTTLPQLPAPGDRRSPQLTSRGRKYRRVSDASNDSSHDFCALPEICVSPTPPKSPSRSSFTTAGTLTAPPSLPSSRGSSARGSRRNSFVSDSSDATGTGRIGHQFQSHHDMFATVLTPRSRSKSAICRLSRPSSLVVPSSSPGSRSASKESSIPPSPGPKGSRRSSIGSEDSLKLFDEECPPAVLSPSSRITQREEKHAYRSLRLLIFAQDAKGTARDKLQAFENEMGTKKQVIEFFDFWVQLDPSMFGEAKFSEFQSLLNRLERESIVHHLQSQKITTLLLNRETGLVLMEDVMEAIWPDLAEEEREKMSQQMDEQEKRRRVSVAEPLLLPAEDRAALERVYSDLARQMGTVTFEALAAARDDIGQPLIDPDRLKHYESEWNIWWGPLGAEPGSASSGDRKGSMDRRRSSDSLRGVSEAITLKQFLGMMCPAGFRAFEGAQVSMEAQTGAVLIRSSSGIWHTV